MGEECGECEECPREMGEPCSEDKPCDMQRGLICRYRHGDSEGVCRGKRVYCNSFLDTFGIINKKKLLTEEKKLFSDISDVFYKFPF